MRVLVTGARGKVGSAAVSALQAAGHEVTATDLGPPVHERELPGAALYLQADLTEAGEVYPLVDGRDAVVHAAAIPDPVHHAPQRVFRNNVMAAFNVVDACVRTGVPRLVNISSETVPGYVFGQGAVLPPYVPVDEAVACDPRDPYGFGKHVVEQWCDAMWRREGLRTISLRPSWVMTEDNYERNLGPVVRDPEAPSYNLWAYTDATDLAAAIRLAVASELDGHEVMYVAQPDNSGGRPLAELVAAAFPDADIELHDLPFPEASGIDSSKARQLLGWDPQRSWRDVLDEDGHELPGSPGQRG